MAWATWSMSMSTTSGENSKTEESRDGSRRFGGVDTFSSRRLGALRLSITQRLTLTSALLTACVLLPAGVALYTTASGSIERESARTVESQATAVAEQLRQQWDDDLIVEFGGQGEFFNESKVDFNDWAIIRPNGRVEREI